MPSSSSSALSSRAATRASAKPVPGCGSRSRRSSSACSGSAAQQRPDVEAEAGEVDRPRHVREVGGHERARRRAVDGLHGRRLEPVGGVLRHALLEERRAAGALREALHQHRPAAHRAHQRLADRGVVADEVELRLAALAEQHLAGARDPHLAPRQLEDLLAAHAGVRVTVSARKLVVHTAPPPTAMPIGSSPASIGVGGLGGGGVDAGDGAVARVGDPHRPVGDDEVARVAAHLHGLAVAQARDGAVVRARDPRGAAARRDRARMRRRP